MYAERRRKNIILRGIPEYRWAEDEDIIYDVLAYLGCERRYNQIEQSGRLGNKIGRRLLMVTFNNERAVEILLDRAAKLRRCSSLKQTICRGKCSKLVIMQNYLAVLVIMHNYQAVLVNSLIMIVGY